jgi:RimJ/RimL family protein N-acetyltransferase
MAPMTAVEIWPVFGIRVRTPRVELRPVDGELAIDIANLAAAGIHEPDFMPFLHPWTDAPPPELQRNTLRHFWDAWASFRPEKWQLSFAVFLLGDDEPDAARTLVGIQAVDNAVDFATLRTFETGSWLGRAHQGKGIGKEMRAAVLHFMFEGLGALEAVTGAFEDNPASLAVTAALGYEPNGRTTKLRRGEPATELLFRLPRARWLERRRDDITIEGLDERCLQFFGLA